MKSLLNWLDSRTGYRDLLHEALYENIPAGARFRYITGSMLVFAFVTQAITGIFLWMAYSPSSQTAYESVWWIQYRMTGGWLLRGIHHFMAQAMVVVLGLHLLQIVVDGAYRKPREMNHWLGLILMQIVLGLGLTGYLLPWDQKGYWATSVATNLTTLVPAAGKEIQQVATGGTEYGHHTLTRFFALHAGVLPALLVGFLALHIAMFRKHGITAHITPGRVDEKFWPKQVLFDAIGCLVVLLIVLGYTIHWDFAGLFSGYLPIEHRGAELGAPSDPAEQYSAARPEWYFLFLFQLLKYFPGTSEVIGAIVLPGVAMTMLALMPFIGRTRAGHRFNVAFTILLFAGAGALTLLALREDYFAPLAERFNYDKTTYSKEIANSEAFMRAQDEAEHNAARMNTLINRRVENAGVLTEPLNIPREGAVFLLRHDPLTQGPKLFSRQCASCHDFRAPTESDDAPRFALLQSPKVDANGKVLRDSAGQPVYANDANGAPNLYGFATVEWIERLLDKQAWSHKSYGEPVASTDAKTAADPDHPDNYKRPVIADFFGNTSHREGDMADFLAGDGEELLYETKKSKVVKDGKEVEVEIRVPKPARHQIAAALAAQALHSINDIEHPLTPEITEGIKLIQENCTACHRFGNQGELGSAPDLTGYGSYEWMMGFVSNPKHARFYRDDNDRMPAFAADLAHPEKNNLSARDISLIVDWLRGTYYLDEEGHRILPHDAQAGQSAMEDARRLELPKPSLAHERDAK